MPYMLCGMRTDIQILHALYTGTKISHKYQKVITVSSYNCKAAILRVCVLHINILSLNRPGAKLGV